MDDLKKRSKGVGTYVHIVLSVGVALHKSFFCHWFALNLSFLSFFIIIAVFVMPGCVLCLSSRLNISLMLSLP